MKNFLKKEKAKKAAQSKKTAELAAGGGEGGAAASPAAPAGSATEVPYKCVPVSGKGMGMVATRDIKYGELILQEKPVMTIAGHTRAMMSSLAGDDAVFEKAFEKLSSADKEKVLSLHDRDSDAASGPGMFPVADKRQKSVAGIFRTNTST